MARITQRSVRRKRTKRNPESQVRFILTVTLVGAAMVYAIYSRSILHEESSVRGLRGGSKRQVKKPAYDKYIVFRRPPRGQGAGNVIAGLLAAHLLGEEFNRLVCISTEDSEWLDVFRPKIAQAIEDCPTLPSKSSKMSLDLMLLNYGEPVNECKTRDALASDESIVWLSGNTYPRWSKVPNDFFTKYYEPTSKLKAVLPWKEPPHTVVHLRHGDSNGDERDGLDIDTLRSLGKYLPRDTFLVTNWLTWYKFFEDNYGWRHPQWKSVHHSALPGIEWADLDPKAVVSDEDRYLQLWADWYTVAMAKYVLHTHSDFSISAVHWMDIESRSIRGLNIEDGSLNLVEESWRVDPVMLPLSRRSDEELQGCGPNAVPMPRKPVKEILAERRHRAERDSRDQQERDNDTPLLRRRRRPVAEESTENSLDDKRGRRYREERGLYRSEQ